MSSPHAQPRRKDYNHEPVLPTVFIRYAPGVSNNINIIFSVCNDE